MCVNGCMHGTFWIEPDTRESMLHVEGQAQYVEGVRQGVVEGVSARAD